MKTDLSRASVKSITTKKVRHGLVEEFNDEVAVEEPLEIQLLYSNNNERVNKNISVTMRTPGNDKDLAAGFLFTEGILQSRQQVSSVDHSGDNQILITLNDNEIPSLQNADRNFYTTSSCGVCGKSSIDAIKTISVYKDTTDQISLNADLFYRLPDTLRKNQEVFESTGGLHASALFDTDGNLIMLCEDVGRHNALDKIIGAAFLNDRLPLAENILLLSGRASFELIQKAAMAGIKIVAAIGAPSSLAVQLAKESGITLIGFLKNNRFNIYSGEQRITADLTDHN
ncbi:MAG: formate dehydrogenase accessory sulfurtransferase FdhD [Ignavibacteria bacterium]|nr:formate dehydrogenase accessory sulfurtransferase FdhD [Ignavibacteria bacterium]